MERQSADRGHIQSPNQTARSRSSISKAFCRLGKAGSVRWRQGFILRTRRVERSRRQTLRRGHKQSRDSRRRFENERNEDAANQRLATACLEPGLSGERRRCAECGRDQVTAAEIARWRRSALDQCRTAPWL